MKSTTLMSAVVAMTFGFTAVADAKQPYVPHGPAFSGMGDSLSYTGTTVGGPLYARVEEGTGNACASVSTSATAVNYSTQAFNVGTSGNYDFTSAQGYFDGFITIYADSFSPAAPLANCLFANDDDINGPGNSEILAVPLQAGRTYFVVTSAFANGDADAFTNTITGVGPITLGFAEIISVDTLSTSTLALLGLLLLGAGFVAVRRFS
jgi:hypothetical protein